MTLLIENTINKFKIKQIFGSLVIVFLITQNGYAQTANPDMAVADNSVISTVVDGDYTYIGGEFTFVGPNTGYGVVATTTNSTVNRSYPKVNGTISVCISDGTGGWYIGGFFSMVGTFARNRIAHIMSDGTVDAEWNPNADNSVRAMVLSGTDLIVAGGFTSIGGQSRNRIAKISTSGTGLADATWNPNASGFVYTLALSGTDLFAGGLFTTIGGQSRNRIAKLSTTGDGSADATWNANSDGVVNILFISGTDLFVGGNFTAIGGQNRNRIAKLSTSGTGSADATWDPNSNASVASLAISGTDLYVGGSFTTIGGQSRNRIAKLSTSGTGSADAIWDPDSDISVASLAISGTDLFVGGSFTTIGGQSRNRIAKLSTSGTGSADATWDPSTSSTVNSIAIYGTNIYFGGTFSITNGFVRNRLAKINNTTGEVDPDWNPDIDNVAFTLAVSGSYLYVGGNFTIVNGSITRNFLARFSTTGTGTVDAIWDPNLGNAVTTLIINSSYVYAGGYFTKVNNETITRNYLARFSTTGTGTVDALWDPNLNSFVATLAINGSDIYAGGYFTKVNNGTTTRNRLAKFPLSGVGTVDASWDPNIDGDVYSLAVSGSDIYVGGDFTTVNGSVTRNRLAKLPLSGTATVDPTWNPNVNNSVFTLAISGSDIYAGGEFFTVNGSIFRDFLARFSTTTGTVDSWDANFSTFVNTIAISGADVYIGGDFNHMAGYTQPHFALFTDRTLPVELVSFTASVTKGVVNLNWETATEVDNNGFEVERATPGTDGWKKIGFIEGHFTTNSPKYYSFSDNPSATSANKFKYRLKQIDNSGSFEYSNSIEVSLGTPGNFLLEQNYPNPFNPSTVIRFQLPVSGMVNIDLYNMTGEKITSLLNETKEAGVHSLSFDAVRHGLSSGIYFYKMTVVSGSGEVFSSARKLSLIK